jgi:hypothetical protein
MLSKLLTMILFLLVLLGLIGVPSCPGRCIIGVVKTCIAP